MNHFLRITSEGGYLGAFAWSNSDPSQPPAFPTDTSMWGCWLCLHSPNITGQAWAGSLWAVRHMF